MITVVGGGEPGEFVSVSEPVEPARVDDCAADRHTVTVHIFRRGMRYDIRAPLDRTALHGRCERIVDNKRNAVTMRYPREFFNVHNGKRGVCDGFAEQRFRIRAERRFELFFRAVGRYERKVDAHLFHCNRKQVERSAVNCGTADDVVAATCDIEHGVKVCRLTA